MSYSEMAARGREAALATNTGQRKVRAERISHTAIPVEVWKPPVGPFPGHYGPDPGGATRDRIELIGACGHVLRTRIQPSGTPDPADFTSKIGRLLTCRHADCKIAPKPVRESRDTDCTWWVGTEADERRCRVTATWDTDHGHLCTRHRDYLLREGYLDAPGSRLRT